MERFKQFIVGFLNRSTNSKDDLRQVTLTEIPTLDKVGVDVHLVGGTGLVAGDDFNNVDITYPTTVTEVYEFKLDASLVQTVTITYMDTTKKKLTSVVYT